MIKSFVTCFDKDCEEFAEVLMTLVSENPSIRNINQKNEVFKKNIAVTSDEYVLTIGSKSSKVNKSSFCDCYSKYGIHIGFRGRKAWISCENFDWDENSLKEFLTECKQLLKDHGMSEDDIDDEIAKIVNKTVATGALAVSAGSIGTGIIMSSLVTVAIMNKPGLPQIGPWGSLIMNKSKLGLLNNVILGLGLPILSSFLRPLFDNLLNASKRRKQQYKLAVVLFCYKYLNEFLGIDTSNGSDGNGAGDNEKMSF